MDLHAGAVAEANHADPGVGVADGEGVDDRLGEAEQPRAPVLRIGPRDAGRRVQYEHHVRSELAR